MSDENTLRLMKASKRRYLGPHTSSAFSLDPKHLVFTLSRYKFVAKMLSGRESALEVGCGDGFGAAIEAFDQALEVEPQYPEAIAYKGLAYIFWGTDIQAQGRSVYDEGATITGNGLIDGACHDDSDYGLKIRDNSLAELDYITVSNNCYGINVDTNSTLEGGWAGNSSEIDYGMIIQGNLKNGIEVRKNSVFEVEYLLLGGSGTNEGNSSEHDDALDVGRNYYEFLRNNRIDGNYGRAIEVEYNSNMDLDDTVITGNGIGLDHSDSALNIGNLSMASINRSDISSGTGGGISVWNGSIVRI